MLIRSIHWHESIFDKNWNSYDFTIFVALLTKVPLSFTICRKTILKQKRLLHRHFVVMEQFSGHKTVHILCIDFPLKLRNSFPMSTAKFTSNIGMAIRWKQRRGNAQNFSVDSAVILFNPNPIFYPAHAFTLNTE